MYYALFLFFLGSTIMSYNPMSLIKPTELDDSSVLFQNAYSGPHVKNTTYINQSVYKLNSFPKNAHDWFHICILRKPRSRNFFKKRSRQRWPATIDPRRRHHPKLSSSSTIFFFSVFVVPAKLKQLHAHFSPLYGAQQLKP